MGIAICQALRSAFTTRMRMAPMPGSKPLTAPTNSPLQDQMRQDYATDLMSSQRELLQQNPSGLGRQEQAISRELNGYVAPR